MSSLRILLTKKKRWLYLFVIVVWNIATTTLVYAVHNATSLETPVIPGKVVIEQQGHLQNAIFLNIGTRLQLFVDDALIQSMSGATLLLHHPIPEDIALKFDAPWEGDTSGFVTVFQDNELYRMYYRCSDGTRGQSATCYAESKDGIHWSRPNLGLYVFHGITKNNIVWIDKNESVSHFIRYSGRHAFRSGIKNNSVIQADITNYHNKAINFAPFKDTNPNADKNEIYKALDGIPPRGLGSPDGINWHLLQTNPIMQGEAYDSLNTALWDPRIRKYVAYVRKMKNEIRAIARRTSTNFRSWSPSTFIEDDDAPIEHLYTNGITMYFRAPDIFLGFPARIVPNRALQDYPTDGIMDTLFMSSRDNLHWYRTFNEAFIRPGIDPTNWNHGSMMLATGVVSTGSGELSIYYIEHAGSSKNLLRRGSLRTDGFVSVHAPYRGGEIVTKPLVFSGSNMFINAATSAAGSIQVEILDSSSKPIDGFALSRASTFYGDKIDQSVTWQGASVKALMGCPVRLRFLLKDADLYSFRFGS